MSVGHRNKGPNTTQSGGESGSCRSGIFHQQNKAVAAKSLGRIRRGNRRERKRVALVERLRRFVEDSHLGFYEIASEVGTSGVRLSMWLDGTARPHAQQLDAIEKFLKG